MSILELRLRRWIRSVACHLRKHPIYRGFGIIVRNGKAFIPSTVRCYSGIRIQVEPVYATEINAAEIEASALKVLSMLEKNRTIPDPTADEWKNRTDPVLAATGTRSWKELARTSKAYGVEWVKGEIQLSFNRLDKKGRWEVGQVITYPVDTPLSVILNVIVQDAAG